MRKESPAEAEYRRERLLKVQEIHHDWLSFLEEYLYVVDGGKSLATVQREIAEFIDEPHRFSVVHAQRSQAKSTIARAYTLFRIIHNPKFRVLIMTGESGLATKISKSIIDSIYAFPELKCLWPDIAAGDRSSVKWFDVHHSLRGDLPDPSIAARGIFSGIQGMRADLIIADDIEMLRNSETAGKRERLLNTFRDLPSICPQGRILALGTHQTTESIYNSFPEMGFCQRFWPGRVPTVEQRPWYGDNLAPSIQTLYENPENRTGCGLDGQQGIATCPEYLGEEVLNFNEKVQGGPFFQLQHMLNPKLQDMGIKPLKSNGIRVVALDRFDRLPLVLTVQGLMIHREGDQTYEMTRVIPDYQAMMEVPYVFAVIDPALGGLKSGDRTGYAVFGVVGGYLYVLDMGSWVGGYTTELMEKWAVTLAKYKPSEVFIESNAGNGALTYAFRPVLLNYADSCQWSVSLNDYRETGQKEVRGINRLAPVIGRGALVMTEGALCGMEDSLSDLPMDKRTRYRALFQITNVTRTKNSLLHDDTFDAISSGVDIAKDRLAVLSDQQESRNRASHQAIMSAMGRSSFNYSRSSF